MHAYVHGGVGTLANLLADNVVIEGGLGREDNNFLLHWLIGVSLFLTLSGMKLFLIGARDACISIVARWSLLWSSHYIVAHGIHHHGSTRLIWLTTCHYIHVRLIRGLSALNDSCFDVTIAGVT
jgi:hypothetical protein